MDYGPLVKRWTAETRLRVFIGEIAEEKLSRLLKGVLYLILERVASLDPAFLRLPPFLARE